MPVEENPEAERLLAAMYDAFISLDDDEDFGEKAHALLEGELKRFEPYRSVLEHRAQTLGS